MRRADEAKIKFRWPYIARAIFPSWIIWSKTQQKLVYFAGMQHSCRQSKHKVKGNSLHPKLKSMIIWSHRERKCEGGLDFGQINLPRPPAIKTFPIVMGFKSSNRQFKLDRDFTFLKSRSNFSLTRF